MQIGIGRDVVVLCECRHQFVDDDARVFVVERVVFGRTIRRPIPPLLRRRFRLFRRPPWIDEDGKHDRYLAEIHQVVEHVRRAQRAVHVLERLAILKDHQARRLGRVILRGDENPVRVLRTRVCLTGQHERAAHVAFRHAVVRQGIRTDLVERVHVRSGWLRRGRRLTLRGRRARGDQRERRGGCEAEHERKRESEVTGVARRAHFDPPRIWYVFENPFLALVTVNVPSCCADTLIQ